MFGTTGVGWLFSLAKDEKSIWGAVEEFYQSVDGCPVGEDGRIVIDGHDVWGTLHSTDVLPDTGDGFAFYHSTRAEFPSGDEFKRKPRISLMGELLEIEIDGRNLQRVVVAVDPRILETLRTHPIVRDDSTRQIFEDCGIVQGAVATLYRADAAVWKEFVRRCR